MSEKTLILYVIVFSFLMTSCFENKYSTIELASVVPQEIISGEIETELALGTKLYMQNCSGCHGDLSLTTKVKASVALIANAINNVNEMKSLKFLSPRDIELIAMALNGPSQTIVQGEKTLYACDANSVRKNTSFKLTSREFKIALASLMNEFGSTLSNDSEYKNLTDIIPSDMSEGQYSSKENSFLMNSEIVGTYFNATYRAGVLVSTATAGFANYPNTNGCLAQATITQACHQLFVKELAQKAFRRDLSTTVANTLAGTIYSAQFTKTDLILETFVTIASYPDFIYKTFDRGPDLSLAQKTVSINNVEFAHKLSFLLTGQQAPQALVALARTGALANEATLKVEIDKLVRSSTGQSAIRRLFRESYGYDLNFDLSYPSLFVNGMTLTDIDTSMVVELDHFFVNEILNKKATFQDLMTSRESLVDKSGLANIYGVTANSNATQILPPERNGFINRAAVLTKKSDYYTSPIKRGRYIMDNVLCDTIGDPPADAPTAVPEAQNLTQLLSTRSRYENLTQKSGTTCIACHTQINAYGFAQENFDSLGRKRSTENIYNTSTHQLLGQVPVNSQAQVKLNINGETTYVTDGSSLAYALGSSNMALMCLGRHLKSFDIRQPVTKLDYCHINESLNVLYGNQSKQGSIYDAIVAYVLSNEFKTWRY